jgi:hypothetical protein
LGFKPWSIPTGIMCNIHRYALIFTLGSVKKYR